MVKMTLRIAVFSAIVALCHSREMPAFATMPAGAPRTQKDKARAIEHFIQETEQGIGQAGKGAKSAEDHKAHDIFEAKKHHAAESGQATGEAVEEFYDEVDHFIKASGTHQEKYWNKNYRQTREELIESGKPLKLPNPGVNSYAPFNRSRSDSGGR